MSTIYRDYLAHYMVEINQVSSTKSCKFSLYGQMNDENVQFLGFWLTKVLPKFAKEELSFWCFMWEFKQLQLLTTQHDFKNHLYVLNLSIGLVLVADVTHCQHSCCSIKMPGILINSCINKYVPLKRYFVHIFCRLAIYKC